MREPAVWGGECIPRVCPAGGRGPDVRASKAVPQRPGNRKCVGDLNEHVPHTVIMRQTLGSLYLNFSKISLGQVTLLSRIVLG